MKDCKKNKCEWLSIMYNCEMQNISLKKVLNQFLILLTKRLQVN